MANHTEKNSQASVDVKQAGEGLPAIQYGLVLPNFGPYSDIRLLTDLARQAEAAGWHGFFISDIIQMEGYEEMPVADPWIALAAVAAQTERLRIGPRVAAPPRRRPWQLAREAVSLDRLSNGRLILGVGSGDEQDLGFSVFREEMDLKKRARMLEESLAILEGLWSGEPFRFEGEHYQFDEIAMLPRPVQQPRIPIWLGWVWPNRRPMERAVKWDGGTPGVINEDGSYGELTPDDVRRLKQFATERRSPDEPFDIVVDVELFNAVDDPDVRALIREHAEAGATWLTEFVMPEFDIDALREGIERASPLRMVSEEVSLA